MADYKVHCPRTGQVVIKHKGKPFRYKHGTIAPEQEFFSKYPHIFHVVSEKPEKKKKVEKTEVIEFTKPTETEGKGTLIDKLPESIPFELPELKLEEVKKGWYIVVDSNNNQVFPAEEGKKCRKKAAEEFINS